jgi:hypothetical protein
MGAQVNAQACLEEARFYSMVTCIEFMFCMERQMTTKMKKFSHEGKPYEVMVIPGRDGFSVRAFDQSGHGIGRMFRCNAERRNI